MARRLGGRWALRLEGKDFSSGVGVAVVDDAGKTPTSAPSTDPLPLGVELRKLRRGRGLSQQAMAKLFGLSAHSAVADYESGKRLPHSDIIISYEHIFGLVRGILQTTRSQALAAIADDDTRTRRITFVIPTTPTRPTATTTRGADPWGTTVGP